MPPANLFAGAMDLVFLVYGAAFLALGLAILVRHNDHSELPLSRSLWLLGGFAGLHGVLEWTDLWRTVHGSEPSLAAGQSVLLLVSYLFLFEFGRPPLGERGTHIPMRSVEQIEISTDPQTLRPSRVIYEWSRYTEEERTWSLRIRPTGSTTPT